MLEENNIELNSVVVIKSFSQKLNRCEHSDNDRDNFSFNNHSFTLV